MSTDGPASNLDDPEPAKPAIWLRPARGVRDTYAYHVIDPAASIDVVPLVGHNLQRGIGEWEYELWDGTPETPAFYESSAPASIRGSAVNLAGGVTDVDEDPDTAPDANWMTATDPTADTDVRFRLVALPGGTTLESGAREQEFRLLVRRTSGGIPTVWPSLTVDLWQNDSFVATLLAGHVISSTTGEVVSVLFDSVLLSGVSNIEVRLRGAAISSKTVEFGAVQLRFYVTNSRRLFRSGWTTIEADASNASWGNTRPFTSSEEPRKIELGLLDTAVTGANLAVTKLRDPTNPDGFLSVGCLPYSFGFQPTLQNFQPGAVVRPLDQSQTRRSLGGVLHTQPVALRRECELQLQGVPEDEAEQIVLRAGWAAGTVRPYGVCLNPLSGFSRRFETLWGRNAHDLPGGAVSSGAGDRRAMNFRLEEC